MRASTCREIGSLVITAEGRSDRSEHGDENTRLTDFGLGNFKLEFELEVTLDDGRPPYTVSGKFKVPVER